MISKNSPIFKTICSMPNPLNAERDYIECQILGMVFADSSLTDTMVFSGGATLVKSYNLCHRISNDLDLACTNFTEVPADRTRRGLQKFRNLFKEFVFDQLRTSIDYAINQDKRFMIATDRQWRVLHNPEQQMSYPSLHVLYKSILNNSFNHICIEIIPRIYDASAISYRAAVPYSVSTPGQTIPTVAYEQTFWDKVFALNDFVHTPIKHAKNFISRHYFDVAQIADRINIGDTIHMLHDTVAYQTRYTTKEITPITSAADIHLVPGDQTQQALKADYMAHADQFLDLPPQWDDVIAKLQNFQTRLNNFNQGR